MLRIAALVVCMLFVAEAVAVRRGFAADFRRRAAERVAAASPHPHNSFYNEMGGAPKAVERPRAHGYVPSADDGLSFPELDAAQRTPLTPLSAIDYNPRVLDYSSTTLPTPAPDPEAPALDSLPHAVPPPPHAKLTREFSFRSLRDSGSERAIASVDGASVSPLLQSRPSEPVLASGPARHHSRGQQFREVIPIDATPQMVEAARGNVNPSEMAEEAANNYFPRFAGVKARAKFLADSDLPMALSTSGPIEVSGPEQRAYRVRARPIFTKRVTISLADKIWPDLKHKVHAKEPDYGPFSTNNEEAISNTDDETTPRLVDRTPHHDSNLLADPETAFGAEAAFLQTEQRVSRSRAHARGGVPSQLSIGGSVFHRFDPLAESRDRRHSSRHFHHKYRSEDDTRAVYEAEDAAKASHDAAVAAGGAASDEFDIDRFQDSLPEPAGPGQQMSFISTSSNARATAAARPQERRSRRTAMVETEAEPLRLPEPNAPRPHAQFPAPPLDLDRFDPFVSTPTVGARNPTSVPSAPARPPPPPLSRHPKDRKRDPRGTLNASSLIATSAEAAARADKHAAKSDKSNKSKAAKSAKVETSKKAALKPSGNAIARQIATAKKQQKPVPRAATPVVEALAAAPPAPAVAGTESVASLDQSLLARMEAEAGVSIDSAGSGVSSQLSALRRLEAVIRSTEERLELQQRVDRLEAEVRSLKQHDGVKA